MTSTEAARNLAAAVAVAAAVAGAVATARADAEPRGVALSRFMAAHPGASPVFGDARQAPSTITRLAVPVAPGREEVVRRWVQAWLPVFGVVPPDGDIALDRVVELDGAAVYRYRQTHLGVDVDGGEVVAGVYGGRIVHLSNSVREIGGAVPPFILSEGDAKEAVRRRLSGLRRREDDVAVRRALVAEAGSPRAVYVVRAETDEPIGNALYYVDARDGRIVQVIDLVKRARGDVYLDCPEVDGATTEVTLANIDTSGFLKGPYADIYSNCKPGLTCKDANRQAKADAHGDFLYSPAEAAAADPFAEVMAFYQLNRAHDWYKQFGVNALDLQMKTAVNCSNVLLGVPCNAGYTAGAISVGICSAADPTNKAHRNINFAYDADIVIHEYTHGFVDKTSGIHAALDAYGYSLSADGVNEGVADLIAGLITDDAVEGRHSALSSGGATQRDMGEFSGCPEDLHGEAHKDGRLFSSATWDGARASGDPLAGKAVALGVASLSQGVTFQDAAAAVVNYAQQVGGAALAGAFQDAYDVHGLTRCGRLIDVPNGYAAGGEIRSNVDGTLQPHLVQYVYTVPAGATSMDAEITAFYQDSSNDALANVTFFVNHDDYVHWVPDNTTATYRWNGTPHQTIQNPAPGRYYVLAAGEVSTFVWQWTFRLTYQAPGAPAVTSVDPAGGTQGTTVQEITVGGSGFASGAVVGFGNGIVSAGTQFIDAATLKAQSVWIHPAAPTAQHDVVVTNPDGKQAVGKGLFTVVQGAAPDGGIRDASHPDAGTPDGATLDAGTSDAGAADTGATDAGAGPDTAVEDAAGADSGVSVPDAWITEDGGGDGEAADAGCTCNASAQCDPACPCDPDCVIGGGDARVPDAAGTAGPNGGEGAGCSCTTVVVGPSDGV